MQGKQFLFGFAVLSMLMTPAFGAEPQVKLPASIIGSWCPSEASGGGHERTNIYNRVAKAANCEGIRTDSGHIAYPA